MIKANNVPRLRFPGFTDAWEYRKLGDIAITYSGGTPAIGNRDYYIGNIPFIRSGEISKTKTELCISSEAIKNSSAKMIKSGDILYALYGATSGEVSRAKLDGAINQAVLAIILNPVNDSDFVVEWLRKEKNNIISTYLQGGQGNLSAHIVKQFILTLANKFEQKKIGTFFSKLNSLITLHQDKIEAIKKYKTGMLQKMFPREGETVPEIRFPGFTGEWEEKRLEDYLEVSNEKNEHKAFSKEDVLSVSGEYGVVNQIEFQGRSFAGKSVVNYGIIKTGYVVYTRSPLKSNPYGIIKTNKGKPGIVSTLYAVYKNKGNGDPNFIQVYFEQDTRTNNYLRPLINKGAKNTIQVSPENALKGKIIFPSKEEQQKIAIFFQALDNLISFHQREYDKLKELKKGLLQQMFV